MADFCGSEGGGAEGDRTPDLRNAIATLSQLSYGPEPFSGRPCAEHGGLGDRTGSMRAGCK